MTEPVSTLTSGTERETAPPPHRLFSAMIFLVFGGMTALGVWSVLDRRDIERQGPLPILKPEPIPDFSLIERSGRTVGRADLLGKVWLANFVFTRCAGPCPELTLRMRGIQRTLDEQKADYQLVTFSLDPKSDRPPVLQEYAKRFHADPVRWWFLTGGSETEMHRLIREGFLQVVVPASAEAPLTHSEYFVLVDRAGRIRAFYDGKDPASKPLILRDMAALTAEPFP